MANELQYYGNADQAGLTVIARVYSRAGVQIGGDIATVENNPTGGPIYIADMPAAANGVPGDYGVRFFSGGNQISTPETIFWDGTAEVTFVELQTAIAALPTPLTAAQVNAEVDTAIADASLATQASVDVIDGNVDAILVDTGTTLPAAISALPAPLTAAEVNAEVDAAIVDASLATQASVDVIDGNVDAILVDTGTTLPAAISALPAPLTAAQVNAEVDAAIADASLATQASVDVIDGNVDAILVDTGTTLPAAIPSAAQIADAVWDEARADHTTAGTYGAVSEWAGTGGLDAAGVRAAVGLASANLDTQLSGIDSAVAGLNDPTAAAVASAVRTELGTELGRIDVAVSTREAETAAAARAAADIAEHDQTQVDISNISAGGGLDAAGVRAAVGLASANLDTQLAEINTNVDSAESALAADIAALPTPLTGAEVNAEVDAALADYDAPTKVELDTAETNILAAVSGSGLDAAGVRAAVGLASANLDTQLAPLPNLDVAVSTRESTTAAAAREAAILAAVGGISTITVADVQAALTAQGYTTGRAAALDNLDAAVSSRAVAGDEMALTAGALAAVRNLIIVFG